MAINWEILKAQYLQSDRLSQLEILALNLTRIQLLTGSGTNESMAKHLIRESQFFIEWIVPGIDLETDLAFATELVNLQRLLSQWKLNWPELWVDEDQRQEIATLAQHWCDRIHTQGLPLAG